MLSVLHTKRSSGLSLASCFSNVLKHVLAYMVYKGSYLRFSTICGDITTDPVVVREEHVLTYMHENPATIKLTKLTTGN